MNELTPKRMWIGASIAWPLLWILIFDRWFFWTPIGLLVTFGIPAAGWAIWWHFYRGEEDRIVADGREFLDMSKETLLKLKKKGVKADKKG